MQICESCVLNSKQIEKCTFTLHACQIEEIWIFLLLNGWKLNVFIYLYGRSDWPYFPHMFHMVPLNTSCYNWFRIIFHIHSYCHRSSGRYIACQHTWSPESTQNMYSYIYNAHKKIKNACQLQCYEQFYAWVTIQNNKCKKPYLR